MMFEALIARSSFGRAVLLIHRLAGLIWIPLTAVGLAWLLSLTSLFGWLDTKMRDVQAMFAAPSIASPDVLVVDIDDASLSHLRDALGSWPYARDKYAMVVDYLNELGARAVVFDIVLSERRDGDEQLQHAIERYGNVVLAASGRDDAGAGDLAPELLGLTWNIPATLPTPRWLGAELPLRRFTAPRNSIASAIGVVSATPDSSDGLLRRLPLFQRFQGLALPTLPLATLFGNATPPAVRFDGERVRIGNYVLPVDAQGRVCLGYARNAKTALEVLPFERLAGAMLGAPGRALDPATIRGRIVIIGSSAFLSDRVATPVGQLTGSYALGLATAMIAGGQLMSPPQFAWSAILLVIAVLPVFSLLAWPAGGPPTIVVPTLSALVCIEAIQLGLLALDRQESAALLPVAIAVIGGLLMSGRQTWLARLQQEARIDAVTHTDALTGLPNRVAFQESLRAAITAAEVEGRSLSLLVLGIDHFQMINDGMGHAAGDELLQALTERLDASRGWSRLGGDEYALIFHGRAIDALEFAHRALRSLKAPFAVAGSSVHITAGVGIAHFPQDGRNEVGLRQSADVALHQAKSLGEGVVREFVPEQGQSVKDQLLLQSELHRAVVNGELMLYCQPQIEIAGGRIVAAEFLVRWNHPVRGLLVPAQFIPFAEKSNLILEIDEWVLRESCR
ncbi:MAG: CHASE2 domain-containing protein, partial [Paucibacter sp.]|nr:CHASE2 domain-containing protein [Roseateles sp.]